MEKTINELNTIARNYEGDRMDTPWILVLQGCGAHVYVALENVVEPDPDEVIFVYSDGVATVKTWEQALWEWGEVESTEVADQEIFDFLRVRPDKIESLLADSCRLLATCLSWIVDDGEPSIADIKEFGCLDVRMDDLRRAMNFHLSPKAFNYCALLLEGVKILASIETDTTKFSTIVPLSAKLLDDIEHELEVQK